MSSGSGYVAPLVVSCAQRTVNHASGGLSGGANVHITGGADVDFDSIFKELSAGLGANSTAELGANSMGQQSMSNVFAAAPLPVPPISTLPTAASHLANMVRSVSPAQSGATAPIMAHGCSGNFTPRTAISLPTSGPMVTYPGLAAAAHTGPIHMEQEVARWMRTVEGNVEYAVGHSHHVTRVA